MAALIDRMRASTPVLSVGILAGDPLHVGDQLEELASVGVEFIHVDVMDGVFCPQLTVGPALVRAIPDMFVKDVHLMIDEPLQTVAAYVDAGASILTFHVEATRHPHRVLQCLAGAGVIRGVALNPGTPVKAVEPLLDELEFLLVLAVNPGWPGQQFIKATEARLEEARGLVGSGEILVGVDGGVTRGNAAYVASLDVDMIVAGSAVFDSASTEANARTLLEICRARGDQRSLAPPSAGSDRTAEGVRA